MEERRKAGDVEEKRSCYLVVGRTNTRVGIIDPDTLVFVPLGFYTGPEIPAHDMGTMIHQELPEGLVQFTIGRRFHHDLGLAQKVEEIFVLRKVVPEMWKYDSWRKDE